MHSIYGLAFDSLPDNLHKPLPLEIPHIVILSHYESFLMAYFYERLKTISISTLKTRSMTYNHHSVDLREGGLVCDHDVTLYINIDNWKLLGYDRFLVFFLNRRDQILAPREVYQHYLDSESSRKLYYVLRL